MREVKIFKGRNKNHDFWESENREVLILKNFQENFWYVFSNSLVCHRQGQSVGAVNFLDAVAEAEKYFGIKILVSDAKIWAFNKNTEKFSLLKK